MSKATQADVTVVSAFGRGNWLASELSESGIKTSLVDVTPSLGRWTPEDWEGPFGVFHSFQLTATQVERLSSDDYIDSVNEGFCVWLKEGPIDLKSPLSPFLLQKRGLSPSCESYLNQMDVVASGNLKSMREEFARDSFDKTWLVHLAHQWACNIYTANNRGVDKCRALPLFAPHNVRRVSRRGYEKGLEWCESKGANVFKEARIKDITFEKRAINGVEIESDWSGVLETKQVVWCLSGEQSLRQGEKIAHSLYAKGAPGPLWSWVRYRLDIQSELDNLPLKFLVIDDLYSSWTHANFCALQKTVSGNEFDVWVRIPSIQRFHKKYLEGIGEDISALVARRIPSSKPRVADMPQNYLYDEVELGPTIFPVFDQNELRHMKRSNWKNFHYCGPEDWESLDWTGQMACYKEVFNELRDWKYQKNKNSTTAEDGSHAGAQL